MSLKFNCFSEKKLSKSEFPNNELGHKTLQEMMQQYEQMYTNKTIQIKRVFDDGKNLRFCPKNQEKL